MRETPLPIQLRVFLLLMIVGLSICLFIGAALGSNSRSLNLKVLLKRLQKHHPLLVSARAKLAGLKGVAHVSGAWPNLRLNYQREQLFPAVGQDQAGIQIQIPLGGRTFRKKDVAKAHTRNQYRYLAFLLFRLRLRFLRIYFQREFLLHQAKLTKTLVLRFRRLRKVLAARIAGGREAAMALTRFDLEVEQQRQQRQRTLEQALVLTRRLSLWSGVKLNRFSKTKATLVYRTSATKTSVSKVESHPVLRYIGAKIAVHQAQLELAQAKAWPDLSLSLAYLRQQAQMKGQPDSHGFMLGATIPLPIFQRNQSSIRRTKLNIALLRRLRLQKLQQYRRQIKSAHKRLQQSRARWKRYKQKLLKRLPGLLKAAQVAFRGGGDFSSFLNTYRSVGQYHLFGLKLKHDLCTRALALEEALGHVSTNR